MSPVRSGDRFTLACHSEPTDATPVWFMRQAGRSLPEYRALRERHEILEICRTPELAAEATLQPVERLGVDAAILFSDIVVPAVAMGLDVRVTPGVGPVLDEPFRDRGDLDRLRPLQPEDLAFLSEAVRLAVAELRVPLIGFGGGPFTLASYLVEGGPSKDHARTKALMHSGPEWDQLMDSLSAAVLVSLRAQAEAGAAALQLFDSWVGHLPDADYRERVWPWTRRIFEGLEDLGVPRIHFGVGTGELLSSMAAAGADVLGVDWRVPLDEARKRVGEKIALQGNLDPALCLAPWDVVSSRTEEILREGGGRGHIFNLGHGVLPQTDPGVLKAIVDLVHDRSTAA